MSQDKKRFRLEDTDPVCDSGIYCYGPLLDTIQMAHIFPDSKTFVDKKLKFTPGKIIKKYEELVQNNQGEKLTKEQVSQFVSDNFEEEGTELESYTPSDWSEEPPFVKQLKSKPLIGLSKRINQLFKDLSRRIKDEVRERPQLYSIIYVPNGFLVPGGRFREFYYWDTYWIVLALLHCGMLHTVKGIVENFLLMVKTYGLVPNGGRIYYTKRSQPPFLGLMIKEYLDVCPEEEQKAFLGEHLGTMEREMGFWEERRSLLVEADGEEHFMFVFGTGGTGPRPESYREDVELAEQFTDKEEREEFYYHMKAGAESGWDYSTRWFIDEKGRNKGSLMTIKTNYIVPVDLNALMYMNYSFLSGFFAKVEDKDKSQLYREKADKLKRAIQTVLWSKQDKMWFDYDFLNDIPRKYFYPSNLFPLWAECYDVSDRQMVAESAVAYMKHTGAIYCKGGVPTSLCESGQQWDFPNAWPPLQHILVAGLLKTEHAEAKSMALTIARRYTIGTMFSCPEGAEVCNMFEKYHVNGTGEAGGGGEYDVQTGFGWTNGVVIEFIRIFGDRLLKDDDSAADSFDFHAFHEEIELNVQFDTTRGKSRLLRRDSNVLNDVKGHEAMRKHPVLETEAEEEGRTKEAVAAEVAVRGHEVHVKNLSQKDY